MSYDYTVGVISRFFDRLVVVSREYNNINDKYSSSVPPPPLHLVPSLPLPCGNVGTCLSWFVGLCRRAQGGGAGLCRGLLKRVEWGTQILGVADCASVFVRLCACS